MKYILGVVFILIVVTLYFVLGPERTYNVTYSINNQHHEAGKAESVPEVSRETPEPIISEQEEISAEDQRHADMQEEFAKLEKSRRNLERKLSRLKALLWDMEFPAEKSSAIKEQMQSGYALLKNKKLLGAYRDLEQLQDELGQVDYIYQSLKEIENEIREIKNKQRS